MHACMHACTDGWMDGWVDIYGIMTTLFVLSFTLARLGGLAGDTENSEGPVTILEEGMLLDSGLGRFWV